MDNQREIEHLNAAKQWFKEYATVIIVGVIIALTSYGSWNLYQYYRTVQIAEASTLHNAFLDALALAIDTVKLVQEGGTEPADFQQQLTLTKTLADQFIDDYGRHGRSVLVALSMAKLLVEQQQYTQARSYLLQAEQLTKDEGYQHIIRYRLAKLALFEEKYDEALTYLQNPNEHFIVLYSQLEADILNLQGNYQAAFDAYQRALDNASSEDNVRLIEIKQQLVQNQLL